MAIYAVFSHWYVLDLGDDMLMGLMMLSSLYLVVIVLFALRTAQEKCGVIPYLVSSGCVFALSVSAFAFSIMSNVRTSAWGPVYWGLLAVLELILLACVCTYAFFQFWRVRSMVTPKTQGAYTELTEGSALSSVPSRYSVDNY